MSPFWKEELWDMWHAAVSFTPKEKKATVTLARAQYIPFIGEKTHLAAITGLSDCSPDYTCHRKWHDFLLRYNDYVCSPLFSTMIIDIMRCAPLPSGTIKQAKIDSFNKEIRVMESSPLPAQFNYDVWFEPSAFLQPFYYDIAPNEAAAKIVYEVLIRWRSWMCSRVHYPRLSNKKVALGMIRCWEDLEGREWNEGAQGIFDQRVGERYLHDTGHWLESAAEIRQKWYHSGLTPRSYYAMGGTAFHRSKHLQDGFGKLVDFLPCTNHVTRLNPTRIFLEEDDHLLIWDLSAFTSNHHEQRHFLERLASFCSGWTIEVMDAEEGLTERDLGTMISTYNQLNIEPEYSMERVDNEYEDLVLVHHIAGFLGVYGNLMTCTFVHGSSVLMALPDTSRLNVAGDDGHAPYANDVEKQRLKRIIRGNGVVEESKLYTTDEDGCVCLKRGLVQIGGRLLQKRMLVLPSLAVLLEYLGQRPPQFSPSDKSRTELRSSVATEVLRFLSSLTGHVLSDLESQFILEWCNAIWSSCLLPENGSVPQYGGSFLCPVKPSSPRELFRDHLRYVLSQYYPGIAVVPQRRYDLPNDQGNPPSWVWDTGHVELLPNDRYLNYMETLGYVESAPVDIAVRGEIGLTRLIREFEEFSPRIYQYTVLEIPPFRFRRPQDQSFI